MRVSLWEILEKPQLDRRALCRCVCGKEKMVNIDNIKALKSISCGCGGKSHIPKNIKRTFNLMKYRCNTKTSPDYKHWGAKGIKVLYKDIHEFYKDVGDKPSPQHSIDRKDGSKSYQVGNCRWATATEQTNNVSANVILEYNGKKQTVSQWSREVGIKGSTIRERLKRGWGVDKTLSQKVKNG